MNCNKQIVDRTFLLNCSIGRRHVIIVGVHLDLVRSRRQCLRNVRQYLDFLIPLKSVSGSKGNISHQNGALESELAQR